LAGTGLGDQVEFLGDSTWSD